MLFPTLECLAAALASCSGGRFGKSQPAATIFRWGGKSFGESIIEEVPTGSCAGCKTSAVFRLRAKGRLFRKRINASEFSAFQNSPDGPGNRMF
jgi:hypothetical protein